MIVLYTMYCTDVRSSYKGLPKIKTNFKLYKIKMYLYLLYIIVFVVGPINVDDYNINRNQNIFIGNK